METLYRLLIMWLALKREHCLKVFVHWSTTQPTTGLLNLASTFRMTEADLLKISKFTLTNLFVKNIEMTQGLSHLCLRLASVQDNVNDINNA